MFVQIHMLQSMPPGNLNRDDTGQPKKCIFGGVTRGRISSQCLKRNIRHSSQFREAFGDALADRTLYLPRMVADKLKESDFPNKDLSKIKTALGKKFKSEKSSSDDAREKNDSKNTNSTGDDVADKTGQLVYFPPLFAQKIAELISRLKKDNESIYKEWINGKKNKNGYDKIEKFESEIFKASETLTVDIALFGRMTTSDLVVNVEATCQVAHAISTHETMIESDYFTAMDDRKREYASTQTDQMGAAFLGSGDTETFFNASVYYKYLNVDFDALKKHLSWEDKDSANAVGNLVCASALANPTGKQNSFAAHGVPELILVEISGKKHPISYANAFLQPVEGRNLMTESAKALSSYIKSVATAFAPLDMRRFLLAVGSADSVEVNGATSFKSLEDLVKSVVDALEKTEAMA